ncbi:glycosyltransferase 87 family protein [Streptomyces bambusae]|uniref:glycosyltransferase 87 family protein n=1 Tax=Streptomyces bambusae TaxID=1550616 RepID=UPI001CFE77E6|nr:glycosyltransferase 87 family protein [Streptomyces bambusae]MCB5167174.1 glycosyltransferase 87 family protein [Streptomyces bambusae]
MLLTAWAATRTLLLLCVFRVVVLPGTDVTTDVHVIYRGWFEVLRTGTFPLDDVTWQYPPGAALAVLSPGLLPFLAYPAAFFLLCLAADAAVLRLLVREGRRPDRRRWGAAAWTAGLPLLGPTVYARYDVMVAAVAVAALLLPRARGPLVALGAVLKVWPVLLLAGVRGYRTALAAAVTAAALLAGFALALPGSLAFLAFQRDRGIEVEALAALPFHLARFRGWPGTAAMNYGSVEFLGPYVPLAGRIALALTMAALGWLVFWRLRARTFHPHTPADAALAAVLLFVTTSRVLSPQYLVWLVALAAVCLAFRGTRMRRPAQLVLAAAPLTFLEFPLWFADVVQGGLPGTAALFARNGLLVAAALLACRALWRDTVPGPPAVSPAVPAGTPASRR